MREIKVDIDGVQKTTDYTPIDRINYPSWDAPASVRFYYGGSWRDTYPWVLNTTYNDVFKVRASFIIDSGTNALNRQWKMLTSAVDTGNESTFVDTGLRVTPTALGAYNYFEGDISLVNVRRFAFLPVSWFSDSVTHGGDIQYMYQNL